MNNTPNSQLITDSITLLRFPLIVAIVFIHTFIAGQPNIDGKINVEYGQYPIYDFLDHIVRICLAEIAVPLFFVISGFLFFYQCNFNRETYYNKLRKRIHSLLIPYLTWNTLCLFFVMIVQQLQPSSTSLDRKLVLDYSFIDILDSYWHFDGVKRGWAPICGPLWFIRDLIIVNLCSPIVYFCLNNKRIVFLLLLGVLYICGINLLTPGLSSTAFFFYSLGAWTSINRLEIDLSGRMGIGLMCLCFFLLIADVSLWMIGAQNSYLHRLFILSGIFAFLSFAMMMVCKKGVGNTIRFLAGCSFFVYLSHIYVTPFLNKCWILVLSPVNEITASIALFIIPLVSCLICIGIYFVMKRCLPKTTMMLVGGRL